MSQATITQQPIYALGHAEAELNRLIEQGRFFGDLTAQVLELAGIGPGMRVLDVGCGAGDVSFLAARMVGPTGMVIGVDRASEAVDLAIRRAAVAGLSNVRFLTEDLAHLSLDAPVDALVGRLVLMYLGDPAVVLRHLLNFVKPGGIIAFHEMDMHGTQSVPTCPLFDLSVQRIRQTFVRVGADIRTGLKLGPIFEEAGLPAPRMLMGARVERGPDSPIYEQVTQITRSLLPMMMRTGVATAEEVDLDTLPQRLRDEAVALNATLVSPPFVCAWIRTG